MVSRGVIATSAAVFLTFALGTNVSAQYPPEPGVSAENWAVYKGRFVDPTGRVIDDGNGGISHSESQGYGMLLAYLAGSRADFEAIWAFTRSELLLRDDGLSVWKWDPNTSPHVTDVNNASDGDILISYALALAGKNWGDQSYTHAAKTMVSSIAANLIVKQGRKEILLPGVEGFRPTDRSDGPVVNLSYWIYEAFPVFAELDQETPWNDIAHSGVSLLRQVISGSETAMPPEWLSIATRPKPAKGFPQEFSYNALRIPLYLARSDIEDKETLRHLARLMQAKDGVTLRNLQDGAATETLTDPGYRIIPSIALCKADGLPVPSELRAFQPTLYYPSTLHLLALAWLGSERCR